MKWFIILKFTTIFLIHSHNARAQYSAADTVENASLLKNAVNLYHRFLAPETGLYNGSEYAYNAYYPFVINQGDPFFKSAGFDTGAVFYNEMLYENVALLYDLVKGELLTHDPTNTYVIRLNSEKVEWFTIFGTTFIRLSQNKTTNAVLRTGFYDLLYKGNIVLYKKISKKINENSSSFQGINKYVVESNEYFIKLNNQYYTADNKKELLLILKDKKKEVGQFIKNNKLNLRKAKEDALIRIIAWYDSLNNNTAQPVNK